MYPIPHDRVLAYIKAQYREALDNLIGPDWILELKAAEPSNGYTYSFTLYAATLTPGNRRFGPLVATWQLRQFPGCCAIGVSFHSMVEIEFRNKGIGALLNQLRIDFARLMGYGVLMCTDLLNNTPSRKLLVKNKWNDLMLMRNPRTSNRVFVSFIELVKGGVIGEPGSPIVNVNQANGSGTGNQCQVA